MLSLCVLRMLEYHVKPLGLTAKQALDEISDTKALIVKLGNREFIVPHDYGPVMVRIFSTLEETT